MVIEEEVLSPGECFPKWMIVTLFNVGMREIAEYLGPVDGGVLSSCSFERVSQGVLSMFLEKGLMFSYFCLKKAELKKRELCVFTWLLD